MAVNLLRNACAISIYFRTFAPDMNGIQKETLRVRIISVGITCLAFVVFKPIGLDALGLMLYLHFLAIWLLGVGVCYVTEGVVTHILGMPTSLDRGVEYIIRRNLWFQLINTPLEALFICAYLHFPHEQHRSLRSVDVERNPSGYPASGFLLLHHRTLLAI